MNTGKYFFIPDWLLKESSQTIHAYIYILNEINNNGGELITTKSKIAKTINITERQVRTILSKMSDQSQTKIKPISNRNTSLSFNFIGVVDNANQITKSPTNSFNFRKSLIEYGFKENIVDDWLKVRKTKRATNTETAFKAFITEIESRKCDINDMLKTAATNSWSGFRHIWVDNLIKNSQNPKPQEEKIGRTSIETIKKNSEYHGEY